ncbi:unnamed protein product [Schistosoma margrebowiei]|uniref:Uncharacterized protein n=1 Tax=Schistosoma margrebowiei TaxID=48269 RepID=A0A183MH72_9TREM|nr:unnamed protein product [Schistosoma margrebowiei]
MVVGGSQQETLNPGFVLLGTRQQGVPETLEPGFVLLDTCQQGVPVMSRELVLPGGFDFVSPSFIVRDVTTELSEPQPTSCRTEM